MKRLTFMGREYRSAIKLSRDAEVNYHKLLSLLNNGMTADEAIETIKHKKYKYNGAYYSSKKEIAKDLGISLRIYEQSDKYKDLRNEISPVRRPFIFRGVQYKNKEAFYQVLGITGSGVRKYAIRHNLTTTEALNEIANQRLGGIE